MVNEIKNIYNSIICKILGHKDRGWYVGYVGEQSIRDYIQQNEKNPIHYCQRCKKGFKK